MHYNFKLVTLNKITNASIATNSLFSVCLTNKYLIGLLKQYGISSFTNIKLVKEINGNTVSEMNFLILIVILQYKQNIILLEKIGWTLGYIVNSLNREDFLPSESPSKKITLDFFTFFIIVQVILPLTLIKIAIFKELSSRNIF